MFNFARERSDPISQVQPTADDVPEVLGQVGSLYFEISGFISLVSFLQASADSIMLLNPISY